MQELHKKDNRVKLVENPNKFQSYGLNRMINLAQGELFLRADGHCVYASDFIEKSVEAMMKSGAKNVGGTQRYIASNLTQAGIAIASKSFFGNGGAKYMDETFEGYSDTVFLGCFWLQDLKKLGGFSEVNRTNEDSEINLRIKEELNGKIYVSPDIKIWYHPRSTFWKLFKQYFAYGRGRYLTSLLHDGKIPFRSKAPFLFVSFIIILLATDYLLFSEALGSIYILGALAFLLLFESLRVSSENKERLKNEIWRGDANPPGTIRTTISAFISLFIMHLAHFFGFGFQMLKLAFSQRIKW